MYFNKYFEDFKNKILWKSSHRFKSYSWISEGVVIFALFIAYIEGILSFGVKGPEIFKTQQFFYKIDFVYSNRRFLTIVKKWAWSAHFSENFFFNLTQVIFIIKFIIKFLQKGAKNVYSVWLFTVWLITSDKNLAYTFLYTKVIFHRAHVFSLVSN